MIRSHARQLNFSRTVWITFHCRGIDLQRLGHILAELDQPALTARADGGRRDDDAFARQMRWQRAPHRLAPGEASDRALARIGRRVLGGSGVLGGARFQFLELQLQLVEQPAPVLRRRPEPLALQLGDQELQMRHHGFGAGCTRLGLDPGRTLGEERRFQRRDVVGNGLGLYAAHPGEWNHKISRLTRTKTAPTTGFVQPARAGRVV